eukprot:scaffold212428_cov15-Tisochrysis_lutea.AAC.1
MQVQEANQMVEEMMLLANVSVAEAIAHHFPSCSLLRRHPVGVARWACRYAFGGGFVCAYQINFLCLHAFSGTNAAVGIGSHAPGMWTYQINVCFPDTCITSA